MKGLRNCHICGVETKKWYEGFIISNGRDSCRYGYSVYGKKNSGLFLCRKCRKIIEKHFPVVIKRVQ